MIDLALLKDAALRAQDTQAEIDKILDRNQPKVAQAPPIPPVRKSTSKQEANFISIQLQEIRGILARGADNRLAEERLTQLINRYEAFLRDK